MRALVFDTAPWRVLPAGAAARAHPLGALRLHPHLRLRDWPEPALPGPDWVRLRPRHAGICGSDLTQARLAASLDNPLSGLLSFPHVMGHEIVAQVEAPGPAATEWRPGTWVVVDPWLGCLARGRRPLCPACADGHPPLCAHAGRPGPLDGLGAGLHLGNVRGLPGGFGEVLVAHRSQCHRLPEGLAPAAAVLADPLAVACHAVERAGADLDPAAPVVVLGAGTVGLAVTAVWRRRAPERPVLVTTAWPHLAATVRELRATPVDPAPAAVVAAVAALTGARTVRPWRGHPWLIGGGAAVVVDTIGAASTMETALAVVRPRGRVVAVGVARPARTETTLTYYKEVEVVGANGAGRLHTWPGRPHAFEAALDLLATAPPSLPRWCTHSFPLERWAQAFRTAAQPWRSGAIKVVLTLPGEPRG